MRFQNGFNKVVNEPSGVQFWSEIILAARSFHFEITRMISDQIEFLYSVQLPLSIYWIVYSVDLLFHLLTVSFVFIFIFDCFLPCLLVCFLLLFRPGSVVAQFQLLFKNILEDEKALNPLKKAVEDGNLGPLPVDAESLKIIKDVEGNRKHPQEEWPKI